MVPDFGLTHMELWGGADLGLQVRKGTALVTVISRPDIRMRLPFPVGRPDCCQSVGKLTTAETATLLEFKSCRVPDDGYLRAMAMATL